MPPDTPARAPGASEFEQIAWADWEDSYWIETISMFETLLFVRVHKPSEKPDNPRRLPEKHKQYMTTPYIKGEDGFVYIQHRDRGTGEISLEPIYTLKGPLGA